jgi:hypothetical protein
MLFNALNVYAYRLPPKSEWPDKAIVKKKFGQKVLWLERKDGGFHLSREDLEPYRLIGDTVDGILYRLDEMGETLGAADDLLLLMENALKKDPASRLPIESDMASFLQKYKTLPAWVDKERLRRGQEVFLAYLPAASLSLYYRSLVAGFSIPKISEVIRSTGYLAPPSRPDQVLQRLLDTGELTTACTGLGLEALLPDGIGWKTALYVRFLHAKVRFALLKRQGKRKWNTNEFGVPINQEDMAATLLAFSVNVLFGIDLIAGVPLSKEERLDYLELWRYLGFLLGVETEFEDRLNGQATMYKVPPLDPCGPGVGCMIQDPVKNSNATLQSIIFHLLDPDKGSVEIAHHLLKITDRKPPSVSLNEIPDEFYQNELFYLRCYNCRQMIGDPLADALELPLHPKPWIRIKIRLKSFFILSLMRIYTLAAMRVPFIRNFIISRHIRALVTFHEKWCETHKSKLARALARGEQSSVLEGFEDHVVEGANSNSSSLCPFAMTAAPFG